MSIELTETEPGVTITDSQIRNAEWNRDSLSETLSRHTSLLGEELIQMIAEKEYGLALEDEIWRRKEGLVNDDQSEHIGVTALFTKESVLSVKEACEKSGYILGDDQLQVGENFTTLRLTEGIYRYGGLGIRFYPKVVDKDELWPKYMDNPSFRVDTGFVVRVQGDNGELWQNMNYTWEGVPKEHKLPTGGWYVVGPASDAQ